MKTRCRHYGSWILAGGRWEWCYRCGSLRQLIPEATQSRPAGKWTRPVGPVGENPAMKEFVELPAKRLHQQHDGEHTK